MVTSDDTPRQVEEFLDLPDIAGALEGEDYKALLDHVPVAILVARIEADGERITYANLEFRRLAGDPKGASWDRLDVHMRDGKPGSSLGRAIANEQDLLGTFIMAPQVSPRDGTASGNVLVDAYASMIEDGSGQPRFRVAVLVDVTARERAVREEHEQAIREKDLLLRELQHRVKNNLQLITALIRMEARHMQTEASAVTFDSLAGRIESLQLLYQQLSGEDHGEEVDLGAYLSQIASAVTRVHSVEGVRLETSVDLCPVTVNVAMPVGLIVNEVLTNAFKYAFKGRAAGTISLTCECRGEGAYQVIVADDGVGLPDGIEWPETGKLGALIVQSLKENARARLTVDSHPGQGTSVTIAFVHRPPSGGA